MHTLLAVCSLLAFFGAAYAAVWAHRAAQRCESRANKLRMAVSRITALEGAQESQLAQLQKLRGTFFAFKADIEDGGAVDRHLARTSAAESPPVPGDLAPFCPNYGQAQIEGPLSPSARCECGYCVEMRARREEFRRAAVPRTATGQAKLATLANGGDSGE